MNESDAQDINLLAQFASNDMEDASFNLLEAGSVDCLVLCGSAILQCAEAVFRAVQNRHVANTLVICGGIGHSTTLLYDAVDAHPRYRALSAEARGLPESQVLYRIGQQFFNLDAAASKHGIQILIEDQSTNCGANAIQTRKVLDAAGLGAPKSIAIVQDPTMSLRTKASFEKTYEEAIPALITCPSFVPQVELIDETLRYQNEDNAVGLWTLPRFIDLLVGEIPRMRSDTNGYGPAGKGFIAAVDIPANIEEAWLRLSKKVEAGRSAI